MKTSYIYILVLFIFSSCVEKFDLELESVAPRLVVEGLVENSDGPHFIRLINSKVGAHVFESSIYSDSLAFEKGATVIISDDSGQTEVLEEVPADKNDYRYHPIMEKFVKYNASNEWEIEEVIDYPIQYHSGGFYKTTAFTGIPGRTYFLKIITKEGEVYTASDFMAPVPTIKKIEFQKEVSDKDGQEFYYPTISFDDPQEGVLNNYLFQLQKEEFSRTREAGDFWEFSIISDEHLNSQVNNLKIDDGASTRGVSGFFWNTSPYELHYIKMSSLSNQSYDFYKGVLAQFEQDGGAYKPTPSSPITNISNNGLGFFRASASVEWESTLAEHIGL
jgi:hypothetical protein